MAVQTNMDAITQSSTRLRELLQTPSTTLSATMLVPTKSLGGSPTSLVLSRSGWLWTVLHTHVIAKVSQQGFVMVVAGKSGSTGYKDGMLVQARFNFGYWLSGIGEQATGEIVFTDPLNHVVRYIYADESAVGTLAGAGTAGHFDGPLSSALFDLPSCLVTGIDGSIFISDSKSGNVRRIFNGLVTTLGVSPEISPNALPEEISPLFFPSGLVYTPKGQLIVADCLDHSLCRVYADRISCLTAGGSKGFVDGPLEDSRLFRPTGLSLTPTGDLLICDSGNHAIRALIEGQIVTLFAPNDIPKISSSSQIPGVSLSALWPRAVALGNDAKVFVADLQGIVVLSGPPQFTLPLPDEMIQETIIPPIQSILSIICTDIIPCLDRIALFHNTQSSPHTEIILLTRHTSLLLSHCSLLEGDFSENTHLHIQRTIANLQELSITPATSVLFSVHITKLKECYLLFHPLVTAEMTSTR
jgi:hypothetical protein